MRAQTETIYLNSSSFYITTKKSRKLHFISKKSTGIMVENSQKCKGYNNRHAILQNKDG